MELGWIVHFEVFFALFTTFTMNRRNGCCVFSFSEVTIKGLREKLKEYEDKMEATAQVRTLHK